MCSALNAAANERNQPATCDANSDDTDMQIYDVVQRWPSRWQRIRFWWLLKWKAKVSDLSQRDGATIADVLRKTRQKPVKCANVELQADG